MAADDDAVCRYTNNTEAVAIRLWGDHAMLPPSTTAHSANNGSLGALVTYPCPHQLSSQGAGSTSRSAGSTSRTSRTPSATAPGAMLRIDAAVSFISIDHAKKNIDVQIGAQFAAKGPNATTINATAINASAPMASFPSALPSFAEIKERTEEAWRARLSVITITTNSDNSGSSHGSNSSSRPHTTTNNQPKSKGSPAHNSIGSSSSGGGGGGGGGSGRRVNAEDTALLTKFYTALYHSNVAPSIYDENGDYLAFNSDATEGKVQRLGGVPGDGRMHAYTDMSIWDIHRTQLPWLSLTAPDAYKDILRSMQAMMEEGALTDIGCTMRFPPFSLC